MMDAIWRPLQRGIGFGQSTARHRSIIGFLKKFLHDWSLGFGSLLAYTFLIALLPIFVTAFGIFGLVFKNDPNARQTVIDGIINSLPDNTTKSAIRQVTDLAANNLEDDAGGILAIGIVLSIWGGSRLFVVIDQIFTIIFRTNERPFLLQNLIAFGMLILFIFLIILMFTVAGIPSFVINVLPGQNWAQFGIFIAGITISIFIAFVFFMLIYKLLPNKKTKSKHIWLGSLIAAFLLDIFIVLFPLYIRLFMGTFLGLLGFAVILITFFYYFGLILIIGAQINAYFFERIPQLPDGLGTFTAQAFERYMRRTITPIIPYNPYHRPRRPPPYYQ